MKKINEQEQLKKDIALLKNIQSVGFLMCLVGIGMAIGIAGTITWDLPISSLTVILTFGITIIGFILAKLRTILCIIFNPYANAKFRMNAKTTAKELLETLLDFFPCIIILACTIILVFS